MQQNKSSAPLTGAELCLRQSRCFRTPVLPAQALTSSEGPAPSSGLIPVALCPPEPQAALNPTENSPRKFCTLWLCTVKGSTYSPAGTPGGTTSSASPLGRWGQSYGGEDAEPVQWPQVWLLLRGLVGYSELSRGIGSPKHLQVKPYQFQLREASSDLEPCLEPKVCPAWGKETSGHGSVARQSPGAKPRGR